MQRSNLGSNQVAGRGLSAAPAPAGAASSAGKQPGDHLRVLLVEPSAATLMTVRKQLQRCSFKVTAVADAAEAQRALGAAHAAGRPLDLVLADYHALGGASGCAAAVRTLLAAGRGARVVLAGEGVGSGDMLAAIDAGAADFFDKPVPYCKLKLLWQHSARHTQRAAAATEQLPFAQRSDASSGGMGAGLGGAFDAHSPSASGGSGATQHLLAGDVSGPCLERSGSGGNVSSNTVLALGLGGEGGGAEELLFDPTSLFQSGGWTEDALLAPLGGPPQPASQRLPGAADSSRLMGGLEEYGMDMGSPAEPEFDMFAAMHGLEQDGQHQLGSSELDESLEALMSDDQLDSSLDLLEEQHADMLDDLLAGVHLQQHQRQQQQRPQQQQARAASHTQPAVTAAPLSCGLPAPSAGPSAAPVPPSFVAGQHSVAALYEGWVWGLPIHNPMVAPGIPVPAPTPGGIVGARDATSAPASTQHGTGGVDMPPPPPRAPQGCMAPVMMVGPWMLGPMAAPGWPPGCMMVPPMGQPGGMMPPMMTMAPPGVMPPFVMGPQGMAMCMPPPSMAMCMPPPTDTSGGPAQLKRRSSGGGSSGTVAPPAKAPRLDGPQPASA